MTNEPRPNRNAVRAEILGTLDLGEAAAENQARIHRLWAKPSDLETAAHYAEVARRTRRLRTYAERILDFLDEDDDSYSTSYDAQYAWHTVRLYSGEHPFGDPGPHDLVDVGHPSQCGTLPPGAVCWFNNEPHRDWWPAAHGSYRLRTIEFLVGGGPDGDDPDVAQGMDIQVLDEATGAWSDWDGDTGATFERRNASAKGA